MVLNVIFTDDAWKNVSINKNILETRDIFINYLMNNVTPYLKNIDDCDDTTITLPDFVTKAERHSIHKMSSFLFGSSSYNNKNGNRYMIVSIVKESVVDWILRTNFQFPPKLIPIEEEFENRKKHRMPVVIVPGQPLPLNIEDKEGNAVYRLVVFKEQAEDVVKALRRKGYTSR